MSRRRSAANAWPCARASDVPLRRCSCAGTSLSRRACACSATTGSGLRRPRVARDRARAADALVLPGPRRASARTATACAPARTRSPTGRWTPRASACGSTSAAAAAASSWGAARSRRRRSWRARAATASRPSPRRGPSAPSSTTGRACRPRPSTAATAGTAPTTASTPTSSGAMTGDVVELAPGGDNRPFAVIDSGWQASIGIHAAAGGPWREPNRLFPAMAKLSEEIRSMGARPGIWVRPLVTVDRVPESWTLPASRFKGDYPGVVLDPSVPEVLALVREDVARVAREWRYDLVKHDFTTYDLFGRWGFEMGPSVTVDGWSFADRSRTSAEIVRALYAAIREAAGASVVIGCNTIGHLGAGLFELQRTGDDTSGREWERTRRWASTRWPSACRSTARSSPPTPTARRSRRRCRGRWPSGGCAWWPRAGRRCSSRTRGTPSARSRRPRCARRSPWRPSSSRRPSRSTGWRRPARGAGGSAAARSPSSGPARAGSSGRLKPACGDGATGAPSARQPLLDPLAVAHRRVEGVAVLGLVLPRVPAGVLRSPEAPRCTRPRRPCLRRGGRSRASPPPSRP